MLIPTKEPINLDDTLVSGQAFRWQLLEGWFHSVLFNNIVKLRATPHGVEFTSFPDHETQIYPLLTDYLRVDVNITSIYSSITTDAYIKAAISRFFGMRILRQDPWECLVSFICSSNSNIPRITKNVESLCSEFGHLIEDTDFSGYTFPSPEQLANAGESRLRSLGLGYRAKFIASVANTVANEDFDLMALREDSYEFALNTLTSLDGVGDKVANCVLLFSLDKDEAFPVDTHIEKRLIEWYLHGVKVSRVTMRTWAQERFGRHAGYANQYLFHDRRNSFIT